MIILVTYYIIGVYLPSHSNIDAYTQELNARAYLKIYTVTYYSCYGTVIFEGDFNGS